MKCLHSASWSSGKDPRSGGVGLYVTWRPPGPPNPDMLGCFRILVAAGGGCGLILASCAGGKKVDLMAQDRGGSFRACLHQKLEHGCEH